MSDWLGPMTWFNPHLGAVPDRADLIILVLLQIFSEVWIFFHMDFVVTF